MADSVKNRFRVLGTALLMMGVMEPALAASECHVAAAADAGAGNLDPALLGGLLVGMATLAFRTWSRGHSRRVIVRHAVERRLQELRRCADD